MKPCIICGKCYEINQLLENNEGDFYCKTCFKTQCVQNPRMMLAGKSKCRGDSSRMFSECELVAIKHHRELKKTAQSQCHTSKRPIQCPHNDCNKFVGVHDLNAHFRYEHSHVAIKSTILRNRNPLTFYPRDIRYTVKQCLILLNLMEPPTSNSQQNKFTMPVLISRVSAAQLCDDGDYDFVDEETECNILSNNDKILIWVVSNTLSNYNCTIAAYNTSGSVRVKYSGPVLQFDHSLPSKICKEGYGLVLTNFHVVGMTENGLKPMNIDIVIHPD